MLRLRTFIFAGVTWLCPGVHAADPAEDIQHVQASHEKTLASDPSNLNSMFILALVYEKKGLKPQALQMWQRYLAMETHPDRKAVAEKHIHLLRQ